MQTHLFLVQNLGSLELGLEDARESLRQGLVNESLQPNLAHACFCKQNFMGAQIYSSVYGSAFIAFALYRQNCRFVVVTQTYIPQSLNDLLSALHRESLLTMTG